jgi:restriction endonuclease S subunit
MQIEGLEDERKLLEKDLFTDGKDYKKEENKNENYDIVYSRVPASVWPYKNSPLPTQNLTENSTLGRGQPASPAGLRATETEDR